MLPTTVKKALNEPPISELARVTGRNLIVRFIEFELIKMRALVTVSGNLNDAQVQFIATQFVEMFPGESLADFKLCFERGAIGQYGEIFRMDGIVLRGWMEKYLDEKYDQVEQKLMSEKDRGPYDKVPTDEQGPGFKLAQEYVKTLAAGRKIPGLSQDDIEKYGKKDPPKQAAHTKGWTYFNVRGVQIQAMTQEHANELAAIMVKNGDLEEF